MLLRLPRCRFSKVYQQFKSLQQHKRLAAACMVHEMVIAACGSLCSRRQGDKEDLACATYCLMLLRDPATKMQVNITLASILAPLASCLSSNQKKYTSSSNKVVC